MNGTKNPLASLGIMGPLIGLIVMALNARFGDNTITTGDAQVIVDQTTAIIYAMSALWTAGTAIWGRVRATKKIALKPADSIPTVTGE